MVLKTGNALFQKNRVIYSPNRHHVTVLDAAINANCMKAHYVTSACPYMHKFPWLINVAALIIPMYGTRAGSYLVSHVGVGTQW